MGAIEWIMKTFKMYPDWANKLECGVCRKTFVSPQAHYEHVAEQHNKKDKYV